MPLHIHAIVEYPDNQNLIILNHIDNKVAAMMMNTNRWGKFDAFPGDKWRLAENNLPIRKNIVQPAVPQNSESHKHKSRSNRDQLPA